MKTDYACIAQVLRDQRGGAADPEADVLRNTVLDEVAQALAEAFADHDTRFFKCGWLKDCGV